MKYIFSPIFCLAVILLSGCSTAITDPNDAFAGQSAEQIYQTGKTALTKKHYGKAIEAFEALDTLYPIGPHSEEIQLDLIYAHYQADDTISADMVADRYIRLFPRSGHVDYAYYMKGLANFSSDENFITEHLNIDHSLRDISDQRQSFQAFNYLLKHFPNSQYAGDAQKRMRYLRNLFANSILNVAKYYLRRHTYVAAANRAQEIVQHYQQSPQTEMALAIMIEAYQQLNLPKQAKAAHQMLQLNFPKSALLQPHAVLQKLG